MAGIPEREAFLAEAILRRGFGRLPDGVVVEARLRSGLIFRFDTQAFRVQEGSSLGGVLLP